MGAYLPTANNVEEKEQNIEEKEIILSFDNIRQLIWNEIEQNSIVNKFIPKQKEKLNANDSIPTPRILIIQNDSTCPPEAVADLCQNENIPYQVIYSNYYHAFDNIEPDMYEGIIVLGGTPGAYEEHIYPWLKDLKLFMKKAVMNNIPILGICLGCQLLAEIIGGKVYQGTKKPEVGYLKWNYVNEYINEDPLMKIFSKYPLDEYIVLFHQDTFDLPKEILINNQEKQNVILLANTNRYPAIFKVGNYTYGYQAHPEASTELVKMWLKLSDDLVPKAGIDCKQVEKYCDQHKENIDTSGKIMIVSWLDLILKQRKLNENNLLIAKENQ